MFQLDVLHYRWLWAALLGGTALVLAFVLAYYAFWDKPQPAPGPVVPAGGATPGVANPPQRTVWRRILLLALIYVAFAIYAIVYTFATAAKPPNW